MAHSRRGWALLVLPLAALAMIVVGGELGAQGNDYPKTHIKLVLGFAPGTGSDILGRVLADKLSQQLPKSVVAENRPGAAGRIATKQVIDSEPDGHTLVLGTNATLIVGPTLSTTAPYHADKDLAPISMVGRTNMVLVVSSQPPAPKSLAELLANLRTKQLTFASAGAGTMGHLASEVLLLLAQAKAAHVAYRGSNQSLTDVMRGEVGFAIDTVTAILPFLQNGSLRPLAVTGTQRMKSLPDVATFAEQGVNGVEVYAWWAVLAPAATPPKIVDKLGDEMAAAIASPELVARMKTLEIEPVNLRGEKLRDFMRSETAFWKDFVKRSGFHLN